MLLDTAATGWKRKVRVLPAEGEVRACQLPPRSEDRSTQLLEPTTTARGALQHTAVHNPFRIIIIIIVNNVFHCI